MKKEDQKGIFSDLSTLKKTMENMLNTGKTHQEVYELLRKEPDFDMMRVFVVRNLAATASSQTKTNSRFYQQVLMNLLLGSMTIMLFFFVHNLMMGEADRSFLISVGVATLYEFFFWWTVKNFKGNHLYSLMIYAPFKIYFLAQIFQHPVYQWIVVALMLIMVSILIFAIILRKKAFPYLMYGGPKKDKNGEYIFN